MAKTNKELAVEVALKVIEVSEPKPIGNNANYTPVLDLGSIKNIIEATYNLLEKISPDNPKD